MSIMCEFNELIKLINSQKWDLFWAILIEIRYSGIYQYG